MNESFIFIMQPDRENFYLTEATESFFVAFRFYKEVGLALSLWYDRHYIDERNKSGCKPLMMKNAGKLCNILGLMKIELQCYNQLRKSGQKPKVRNGEL